MIAHIDADAFFASCEILRDPSLKGKPVAVGHDICIAKNYIAKAFGIKTGTPRWEAVKLCPNLILLPVNFTWYGKVSSRMFKLVSQFSPTQEITSIDECYLDLSVYKSDMSEVSSRSFALNFADFRGSRTWKALAETIRTTVERELGITVSVGIGTTKTIAKIASDFRKPNQTTVVLPEHLDLFLKKTPIGAIPGIGRKLTPQMLALNITTAYDFCQIDLPTIRKRFGKHGTFLWHELNGHPQSPVSSGHTPPKSIIRSASFDRPITDRTAAWSAVVAHTQRILVKLQSEQLMVKRIGLLLREKDFTTHYFETDLPNHTQDYPTLIAALKSLWSQHAGQVKVIRSTGVGATLLIPEENYQYSLFESIPQHHRSLRLETAIELINRKHGNDMVKRCNFSPTSITRSTSSPSRVRMNESEGISPKKRARPR